MILSFVPCLSARKQAALFTLACSELKMEKVQWFNTFYNLHVLLNFIKAFHSKEGQTLN